jgi:hypothetical protein
MAGFKVTTEVRTIPSAASCVVIELMERPFMSYFDTVGPTNSTKMQPNLCSEAIWRAQRLGIGLRLATIVPGYEL